VGLSVRAIAPDELATWLTVNSVVFHVSRSIDTATAYHRDRLEGDVSRCLAAFDGPRLVATYESFAAELTLPGSTCLTANAVTAVAVLPTHHRRGALTSMLAEDLRGARERGEAISILIAAEYPIYGRFGFGPATHQAAYRVETAHADFGTSAPASGRVELVEPRDLRETAPHIFEVFRHAVPGQIDRRPFNWEARLGLRAAPWQSAHDQPPRCALYTSPSGEPEGYAVYRVEGDWVQQVPCARLHVEELTTITPAAYLGLWRYLVEVDLVSEININMRPLDEPLAWMLANARKSLRQTMRADLLWARPLDTARVLEARRYAVEERLVLDVEDPLGIAGGRFALEAGPLGARCHPTSATPDLSLSMSSLGAITLGGVSLLVLHAAGRIQEERPGALDRAERAFHWPVAPWCSTFF
jgi:predicted acetyltransferase